MRLFTYLETGEIDMVSRVEARRQRTGAFLPSELRGCFQYKSGRFAVHSCRGFWAEMSYFLDVCQAGHWLREY